MRHRNFRQAEGGNFAMMFALLLPVLLGSVGLAVDVASMMRAHANLQNATDAAVLAASRINDKALERSQIFQDFLSANLQGESGLENVVGDIDIDTGLNYISTTGTAAADVKLHFGFLFGEAKRISVKASAYEARNNLEVVMALDNTGSMGASRMAELRKAATSLVDILALVHSPDTEPKRVVRAGLVPFVTAVNVKGEGFKWEWIDTYLDTKTNTYKPRGSRLATYHGANFDKVSNNPVNHLELFRALGVEWKGCIEARPAPYNLSDAAPVTNNADTMFVPYFAPDNPGKNAQSPNSGSAWNNSYLNDSFGNSDAAKLKNPARYYNVAASNLYIRDNQSRTTGPNYACPTPIVPLTSDFGKLKTEIGKMIHWEGSGTNVSEGLSWSYRVLSPGEPYTQGAPFRSEQTSKFVVVFTDGENTVFGASSQPYNTSDYGSYSFLDGRRIGNTTNRNTALTQVNTWTLDACETLKAQEVEIFTVLLGADTPANRKLYTECATSDQHYFATNDVSQLDGVFKKIASRIAKLYVTQ